MLPLLLLLPCRLEAATAKGTAAAGSSLGGPGAAKAGSSGKPAGGNAAAWDAMNGIAANLLLHLTSSVRFEGTLNTDLNDITMNLVRRGWQPQVQKAWCARAAVRRVMRPSKLRLVAAGTGSTAADCSSTAHRR